jgi:hypothetical protein
MKKNLFAFCFLLLSCISLSAQIKIEKMTVNYGEELPDDKQKIVKIIGESATKIYA